MYGTAVNLASLYQIIITLKVKTEPRRHNMIIQDKCYDFNLICFVQAIAGRPSTLVFGGYTFFIYKDNAYDNIVNEDSPSRFASCGLKKKMGIVLFYKRGNEGTDTDLGTAMIGEYE